MGKSSAYIGRWHFKTTELKKIIITGSTGFIGSRFIEYNNKKYEIKSIPFRSEIKDIDLGSEKYDALVHFAGIAHVLEKHDENIYEKVNYAKTLELANRFKNQIDQFVFISSIKVYGEYSDRVGFNEQSDCKPIEAYGISKLRAEKDLFSINDHDLTISIVRPALVYGPGVKGNMKRLLDLISKEMTLPFGGIDNSRSIIFIDNLIEQINRIIDTKASGVFIGVDKVISSEELISSLQKLYTGKVKLFKLPMLFRTMIRLLKPKLYTRLFGSFKVTNEFSLQELKFQYPYDLEYGLEKMIAWHKQEIRK